MSFKKGQVVTLISGSADMTVGSYNKETKKVVVIYWTNEIGVTSVEVPEHVLMHKSAPDGSDEEIEVETKMEI